MKKIKAKYSQTVIDRLKSGGRKRKWLASKLVIDESTLYRKLHADTFTATEKKTIETLLSK